MTGRVSVVQAAILCHVSRRTIYYWIKAGRLASTGAGQDRRVVLADPLPELSGRGRKARANRDEGVQLTALVVAYLGAHPWRTMSETARAIIRAKSSVSVVMNQLRARGAIVGGRGPHGGYRYRLAES